MSNNQQKQSLYNSPSLISKACWPRSFRRSLGTSRHDQWKRSFFRSSLWGNVLCSALVRHFRRAFQLIKRICVLIGSLGLLGLAVYVSAQWSLIFTLVSLGLGGYLVVNRFIWKPRPRPLLVRVPRTQIPQPVSSLPIAFPETPVPTTPLVRVLETIDLSSSGVKHFLQEDQESASDSIPVSEAPSLTYHQQ